MEVELNTTPNYNFLGHHLHGRIKNTTARSLTAENVSVHLDTIAYRNPVGAVCSEEFSEVRLKWPYEDATEEIPPQRTLVDFLDFDLGLCFFGLAFLLRLFVNELAKIHYTTNRRSCPG